VVEHQLPKLRVAGSIPVSRSNEESVSKARQPLLFPCDCNDLIPGLTKVYDYS
jgi:hypothetical protein